MLRRKVHITQGIVAEAKCQNCGKEQDGYTGIFSKERPCKPEPGDVVMCGYCATLNVYGGGMTLRPLAPEVCVEYLETNTLVRILRKQILQKIASELTGKK